MTDQELINAGYKRFKPAPFQECVTDLFEKLVSDDVGKKYFIHIEKWDFRQYTGNNPISYEAKSCFTEKDTNNSVQIIYLSGFTIKDMEAFYEKQWETGMYDYYERWER